MWRNGLIASFGILLMLITAAFVVPGFLNWNNYRETVTASLARAMQADVTIHGDIHFRMLPRPQLDITDADIETANWQAHVAHLTLATRLTPLWHGQLEISRADLTQPQMTYHWRHLSGGILTRPEDTAPLAGQPVKPSPLPVGTLAQASGSMADTIALKEINVHDGMLAVILPDPAAPVQLTAFNGRLTAAALHGPYEFKGRFSFNEQNFTSHLQIGVASGAGSYPVAVLFKNSADLQLRLDGALQLTRRTARLLGDATLTTHEVVFKGPLKITDQGMTAAALDISYHDTTVGAAHLDWAFANAGGITAGLSLVNSDAATVQNLAGLLGAGLPAFITQQAARLAPWATIALDYNNGGLTALTMTAPLLKLGYADGLWQASGDNLGLLLDRLVPAPQPWALGKPFYLAATRGPAAVEVTEALYDNLRATGSVVHGDGGWHGDFTTNQLSLTAWQGASRQLAAWPAGVYNIAVAHLTGLPLGAAPATITLDKPLNGQLQTSLQTGPLTARATFNGQHWQGQLTCGKGTWPGAVWPQLCLSGGFTTTPQAILFENLQTHHAPLAAAARHGRYDFAKHLFTGTFTAAGGSVKTAWDVGAHTLTLGAANLQLAAVMPNLLPAAPLLKGTVGGALQLALADDGRAAGRGTAQFTNFQFNRFNLDAAAGAGQDPALALAQPGTLPAASCRLEVTGARLQCHDLKLRTAAGLAAAGNGFIDWHDSSWDIFIETAPPPALRLWYHGPWADSRLALEKR